MVYYFYLPTYQSLQINTIFAVRNQMFAFYLLSIRPFLLQAILLAIQFHLFRKHKALLVLDNGHKLSPREKKIHENVT